MRESSLSNQAGKRSSVFRKRLCSQWTIGKEAKGEDGANLWLFVQFSRINDRDEG